MGVAKGSRIKPGTVADITQRLLLWARRSGSGLALIEYKSDVTRRKVIAEINSELAKEGRLLREIPLLTYQEPTALLDYLLNELETPAASVVSIHGFFDAFNEAIPVEDSLRTINLNRERIASFSVKQIWWMNEKFLKQAEFAMPDLLSWFMPRLRLTETESSSNLSTVVMQSIAGSVGSIGNNISFNQISPTGKDSHKISLSPTNVPGGGSQTFVGRAETLQQLHRKLSKDDSVAITAIQGMGGIGKTELARQYAKQYAASYPGGRCWLQVRELDVASQIVAFARVYLRIEPPDELALLEQVVYCWNHWPGSERVLVVYDDVTKSEQVAAVLPPGSGRFAVLMTTRRQHLAVPVEPFEIEVLNEAAALELLRQIVGVARTETQLETAKAICEWVGYLPLGLELLGQYLRQKPEVTYQTLQRRLELQRTAARALQKAHPGMTGSLGVIEAFELSQQTLPKEAQDVACWLSLFALAPIPWELAESRIEEIEKKAFEDGRDTLISRSLLQRLNLTSYQLHPLVREYFLTKLAQREDSDAMRRTYCQIMVALAQQMPSSPTRKLLLRLTPVMPHIAEVATSWQDWLSDKDDELAWPFVAMARFYEGQGAYTQAEPWYVSCLQATQNRLGEEHPAVAASLNNLATLYKRQGRYEEAEPLYAQSLKLRCKLLGEKHPAVATSLNNLATLYENQGRYEEAEPLYVQSLELSRELLGEEHPTVATSLNNLAALYLRQARYEEAEPLYVRSLELGRKLLGKEHPTVATSLNNLAALYEIQGRYKEAEPLYLQSLELRHRLLGEEHPDVATSLNNLAHIYKSQGRYKEAEPLFLESLKFNRQSLGEEHPDVATSLNNLAALYENQSRYEEAETLYMKSLAMRQKLLGERHLAVATSLDNLAGLYSNQGRYEEADSLYMQAIAVLRSHDKITPKPV